MTNPTIDDVAPLTTPPTVDKTSVWEDFIDIFHSPSAVFARRENGSIWIPLIVVTLLVGALAFAFSGVLSPIRDAEMAKGMAATLRSHPELTAEQIASGRKIGDIIAQVAAFVLVPIAILLMGVVTWAVGKMFEAKESLHTAIVIAAYAFVPRVVESVIDGVQAMLMDPASLTSRYSISLSAARFVNPDSVSPIALAILGHIDVFAIWMSALLAIGLAVTGRIPRSRAALAGLALWVVGLLPGLLQAARS